MTWNLNSVKLRYIKYCQAFLNFALSNLTKICLCCYIWSWLSGRINSFLRTGMMSDECSRWQNSILPMWSVMLRKFQFRDFKILHKAMPPLFTGKITQQTIQSYKGKYIDNSSWCKDKFMGLCQSQEVNWFQTQVPNLMCSESSPEHDRNNPICVCQKECCRVWTKSILPFQS